MEEEKKTKTKGEEIKRKERWGRRIIQHISKRGKKKSVKKREKFKEKTADEQKGMEEKGEREKKDGRLKLRGRKKKRGWMEWKMKKKRRWVTLRRKEGRKEKREGSMNERF